LLLDVSLFGLLLLSLIPENELIRDSNNNNDDDDDDEDDNG
jgi:hypothetical protein